MKSYHVNYQSPIDLDRATVALLNLFTGLLRTTIFQHGGESPLVRVPNLKQHVLASLAYNSSDRVR